MIDIKELEKKLIELWRVGSQKEPDKKVNYLENRDYSDTTTKKWN